MASSPRQHAADIDELSASTEEKLLMLPPLSSECCIYRVPRVVRALNERHFTPQIVSIGPIHYQNENLRANEHLKERYLAEFRQHTGVSLKECYKIILDQESRLRNCYAHVIELNSENFVKMVLVDAAFLLMILVYSHFRSLSSSTDQLFKKPKMILYLRYDLLLLENQLPFFILEDLYKLSKLHNILEGEHNPGFSEETATTILGHEFIMNWEITRFPTQQLCSNAVHILDLLRSHLIPTDWIQMKKVKTTNIPSTKELHQTGVKFRVGSEQNMFDIKFHDGILEVPLLAIDETTELIFQNILAFEICHCLEKHIFSDYFEIMRMLTLSSVDSELLIQNGLIDNALPNAEWVTTLFHNISLGNMNFFHESPYSDVIKDLNDYYKGCWHKWKATLKHKYFKAPWAICSVSAAVFLIVLAIALQVVLPK